MRTQHGHLGIVRDDVKEGDLICILYGCSVPVILRQIRKTHQEIEKEHKDDEKEIREKETAAAMRIYKAFDERRKRRLEKQNQLQNGSSSGSRGESSTSQRMAETGSRAELGKRHADHDQVSASATRSKRRRRHIDNDHDLRNGNGERALSERNGIGSTQAFPNNTHNVQQNPPDGVSNPESPHSDEDKQFWYEFKGECYVHSMMDGEAIKYQNQREIPSRVFELR